MNPNSAVTGMTETTVDASRYEGVEHLMPQAPAARAPENEGQTTFFDIGSLKGAFPEVEKVAPFIDSDAIRKKVAAGELPRYSAIICQVFFQKFRDGDKEVLFTKQDLVAAAREIDSDLPANLSDLIYSQRRRGGLPDLIQTTALDQFEWLLDTTGRGKYRFLQGSDTKILVSAGSIPTIVDDQSSQNLLDSCIGEPARIELKVRENNLLERFLGMPLSRVLGKARTHLTGIGQTEIDGILLGAADLPDPTLVTVQIINSATPLRPTQVNQGAQIAAEKYPDMISRSIVVQALSETEIALFEIQLECGCPKVVGEALFTLR